MATLLIELEGPMQSWGYRSRFYERDTGREPSKSGIIGLVAASLGRSREADISDLSSLKFGVRVDKEGKIKSEYQTAQNIIRAGGGFEETKQTHRYYLADARFVAGLEGDYEFLSSIQISLCEPIFMPFLGRRSYTPVKPFINPALSSLVEDDLLIALINYPYYRKKSLEKTDDAITLRLIRDADDSEESPSQDYRQDVPVSFGRKEYLIRKVITEWITPTVIREV